MTARVSDPDDMPDPIAADAPSPDDVEGDTVSEYVHIDGTRWIGADYDGARYCIECINLDYLRYGIQDPYRIPYGGPNRYGAEVDCPGSSCDHCHRHIANETILHYDGVCRPDWCPVSTECSQCEDPLYDDDSALVVSSRPDGETFERSIVCVDCGKRGGVDPALARPVREILRDRD